MIPLSPPCSPLRDLLNVIHGHLICDQEYNGSGKLEGAVLCLHRGVLFRIIVDCLIASWRRAALKVASWRARNHISDNRDACCHVEGSFNFMLTSGAIFAHGIAAVLLN